MVAPGKNSICHWGGYCEIAYRIVGNYITSLNKNMYNNEAYDLWNQIDNIKILAMKESPRHVCHLTYWLRLIFHIIIGMVTIPTSKRCET